MRSLLGLPRRGIFSVFALALPAGAPTRQAVAAARRPPPAIPDAQAVPPTSVLGIISGGLSGTYIRIATDIASVFASRAPEMRILPIVGKGSLQNISDILNIRDVDIGIVQSDVLSFLRQKASLAGLDTSIGYLAKLYDEEVHVLVRQEIANAADLTGKKVNVDALGSGTALTASVVFDALEVKPQIVNDDQETALGKLKRGEIDGLVYVTGKPARLFTDAAGSGLHLLALPLNPALLQTYLPSRFEHADYPGLVPEGATVETVAVGAVMAVYNWTPGIERYTRLSRFVDAFFDNLSALQTPPHHPKWKQVSLTAQVPGWTRFRAAQLWLQRHGATTPEPGGKRPSTQ
jgi:TRAP transporter TAXI family solute receptor